MPATSVIPRWSADERTRFILRQGVLRYGVPLSIIVTAWVVASAYGTTLERLQTGMGWLRLLLLILLGIGEWAIGAGWLIGAGQWYFRQHLAPGDRDEDERT